MRWRKPLLVAAVVLLLVLAAGGVALHVLVDPQKLKAAAEDKARATFGRELHIGELELRYLPLPSLRAKQVTLDSPELAIEQLDVRVGVLPMLTGKIRDVRFSARFMKNDQPLDVSGTLDDLGAAISPGRVDFAWKESRATLEGRIPLTRTLDGHDVTLEAKSGSLDDVFAFLGFDRGKTEPMQLKAASRGVNGRAEISGLVLLLGDLHVRGELQVTTDEKRLVTGHLESDRVDWLKVLQQTGGKLKPRRHDEQIFHADPVAWRALELVGTPQARIDVRVASVRLGNGLELRDIAGRATLGDERVILEPLRLATLGGTAKGSLRFDARKKTIRADIDGDQWQLGQWFRERGSKIPFSGGPMQVKARITLAGDTFRDLASSVDGQVTLRMGKGVWSSAKAGEVEEMMVSALAAKGSGDLRFECAGANLDFKRGRAEGKRLVGARSDVSQLLTSGSVDFREEKVDLRGQVLARKGVTLGIAAVAGGIQISGRLAKPHIGMDPDEKPALLARAAAAIATTGASLVGEALIKAASKEDPCEAVFK